MALCNVTGLVYLMDGSLARSRVLVFQRDRATLAAEYLGTTVPQPVFAKTGPDGAIDVDLLSGLYEIKLVGPRAGYLGRCVVPDAATARLEDIIDADALPDAPPVWLGQVIDARDAAEDAADRAEDAAVAVEGAETAITEAQLRKNTLEATRAPLPTDDETQGYAVGSRWLWQGQEWVRTDSGWVPVSIAPYPTRNALATAIASGLLDWLPGGTILWAGGLGYLKMPADHPLYGTDPISDMSGLAPFGDVVGNHFGAAPDAVAATNVSALQAAADYCAAASIGEFGLIDGTYNVNGGFSLNARVEFKASGGLKGGHQATLTCTGSFASVITVNHHQAAVRGVRMVSNGAAARGVTIASGLSDNGNIEVTDNSFTGFDYDFYNEGSNLWKFERNYSLGCRVANVYSADYGLNSTVRGNFLYSFGGSSCNAIELHTNLQQPEGVRIADNVTFTTGGRPFVIDGGLEIYLRGNIFDQAADGGLVDGSTNPVRNVYISSWIGANRGSAQTAALTVQGPAGGVDASGSTLVCRNARGIWLKSGTQNFTMMGGEVRVRNTTGNEVGFQSDGAFATRIMGVTFDVDSGGRQVYETSAGTGMWFGNRFANHSPVLSDHTDNHMFLANFGYGTSPGDPPNFSFYLPDGSPTDLALAFQSSTGTGVSKTASGFGFYEGGSLSAEIVSRGLRVPSGKAILGDTQSVGNDSAISITPQTTTGIVTVSLDEGVAEWRYRADGIAARCEIVSFNAPTWVAAATGVLSGTTGAVNYLTVSASTDGNVYVENRRGSIKTLRISFRA